MSKLFIFSELFRNTNLNQISKCTLNVCRPRPTYSRTIHYINLSRTFSSGNSLNVNNDKEIRSYSSKGPEGDGPDTGASSGKKAEQKRRNFRYYIISLAIVAGAFHFTGYASRKFRTDAASKSVDRGNDPIDEPLEACHNLAGCCNTRVSAPKNTSSSPLLTSHGVMREKESTTHRQLRVAIKEAETLLTRFKLENLCPGMTVAVTVDGKQVWAKGFGLSDVENEVPCTPETIMRIASISKPLTMTVAARLWQEGKLDLDKSIQEYVPAWPDKFWDGKKVTITTRQLVSMLGGVRHYDKECGKKKEKKDAATESTRTKVEKLFTSVDDKKKEEDEKKKKKKETWSSSDDEFTNKEYYIRRHYDSVTESLDIFKDDPLCSLPGSSYLYTTYGWTLVSAVIEGATGKQFPSIMRRLFADLGLESTRLELDTPLVYGRSRYYKIDKKHRLVNVPYVNNSYKWAGGGFISTSADLCRFGNAMLYCYQQPKDVSQPPSINTSGDRPSGQDASWRRGYLSRETIRSIWTPVDSTRTDPNVDGFYAMGWGVIPPKDHPPYCRDQRMFVAHTGGAVGASSVLLILPRGSSTAEQGGSARVVDEIKGGEKGVTVEGVVVAIMVNMQSVGMQKLALQVARIFESIPSKQ